MRVWIDATAPGARLDVFGMSMLERVLRGLRLAAKTTKKVPGFPIEEIRVALPADSRSAPLPADLLESLPLIWDQEEGCVGARLRRAFDSGQGPLLALAGNAVTDTRLFAQLAAAQSSIAYEDAGEQGPPAAALRLESALAGSGEGENDLMEVAQRALSAGAVKPFASTGFDPYIRKLRRVLPLHSFVIGQPADCRRAERFLFESNYKGSTDFMTKYVYPPLVWLMLRPATRLRLHPNYVTAASIVCTFAAIPYFAMGEWVPGLVLSYVMSVLDSLDGKIARTTFRSSRVGNILDHGLDQVHPPMWYMAWAWPLSGGDVSSPVFLAGIAWTVWYVIDRIVAQAFKRRTHRSIHAMRPIDVRMRTFISRRNVNLPLFTLALPLGLAVPAFYVMALWQVVSALFHLERLVRFWNWQSEGSPPDGPG